MDKNVQSNLNNPKIVSEKLLKSFIVCGFNEQNIIEYNPESNNSNVKNFIQNIDIIEKDLGINLDKFEKENELWYDIMF